MNATRSCSGTSARPAEALRALVVDEGVGVAEATQWCAGSVTTREVARLRRVAETPSDAGDH